MLMDRARRCPYTVSAAQQDAALGDRCPTAPTLQSRDLCAHHPLPTVPCASTETTPVPGMVAAAVALCFLLLLLGLLVAFCMYRRRHRGEADSQGPAMPAAMGSFVPVPLQCCAGTPRFVPTTSSFCTPRRVNRLIHAPQPGVLSLWSGTVPRTVLCSHHGVCGGGCPAAPHHGV